VVDDDIVKLARLSPWLLEAEPIAALLEGTEYAENIPAGRV